MSEFLRSKPESSWNELDKRGKFPEFIYESTVTSFKNLSSLLPWWKGSPSQGENQIDESSVDMILLSDSDTADLSRYKRPKPAFSLCSKKGERVIDKMAVKIFFKSSLKREYYDKTEKWDMTEDEWFNHYSLLASNAYDLESSVGSQTAISWALCCFKAMPERVPSEKRQLELLTKLCFVWYNFTLELRYRCVAKEEDIIKSFNLCRESFDELIIRCELEDENKNVVNSFLNLIKESFLSRICIEHKLEAESYLTEFFKMYRDLMYIPQILIALYYYEAASMAYFKDDVVALDHLNKAFLYLHSSSVAENTKWKYMLDLVYDLARYYTKVDSVTKTKSKELCDRVFLTLEHKQSDEIRSANAVLLALALCYLAIALDLKSEADKYFYKINELCEISNKNDFFLQTSIDPSFVNTLVSFATAVYPHFAEMVATKNIDITHLLTFVYDCVHSETYGYKYIFNVTFLLSSIQYHRSDSDLNMFMADCVLARIDVAKASPEILSYYLIATMLKGVCHYQQNKPDDGKELFAKASSDSFAKAIFYHFASYNHRCFQDPSLLHEVVDSFLNDHMNIVEKAIVLLAGDQFREKFPSFDENKKVLVKIFSHFSQLHSK